MIRRNIAGCSSGCRDYRRKLPGVRRGERPYTKSKNNLEKLNPVPFSGMIGVERCVLHPNPVASRRPRIEHLKRVATGTKGDCGRIAGELNGAPLIPSDPFTAGKVFRRCSMNDGFPAVEGNDG